MKTVLNTLIIKIYIQNTWGSHASTDKDWSLLECCAVWTGEQLVTFSRIIVSSLHGHPALTDHAGTVFLWNVHNYALLNIPYYPRRFESLSTNISVTVILSTQKSTINWMEIWGISTTKKITVSKHLQNTCLYCNIFENAFYYIALQHGQQKVCEIQDEILLRSLLLWKTPSPSAKPPTTPSFLLAISFQLYCQQN